MRNSYRYLCGVPHQFCGGSLSKVNALLGGSLKIHGSSEEAFRCMERHLIKNWGYLKIGPREFFKEGEPVLVLTKKSRYGSRLRAGKMGERNQPDGRKTKSGAIV